jgi:oligopeptide/dipeptide ABC transporter ATP-binding protein
MTRLRIRNLKFFISGNKGLDPLSRGVDLKVNDGESLALIGESGCGKTMTALAILGLLPPGIKADGTIAFNGKNILSSSKNEIRQIRGREIAMIFEQPSTCLNPCFHVGMQVAEAVRTKRKITRREAREKALEWIQKVGVTPPERQYYKYPHQLSGGMQQRIMIASALAGNPSLLIADEPTTSLDMTVQAQIMALIRDLLTKSDTSLLLITHDLALAVGMCETTSVMYAGEIIESGSTDEIVRYPRHPYTKALVEAFAPEGFRALKDRPTECSSPIKGCAFYPRCPLSVSLCRESRPELKNGVRCHKWHGR